jgi:hypothetical protein
MLRTRTGTIVDEYIDKAKSAKTADRPEFQRMVAAAQKPDKNFKAILVHKFQVEVVGAEYLLPYPCSVIMLIRTTEHGTRSQRSMVARIQLMSGS